MQNNFQGLANAILSHSDDSLTFGAEAATLVGMEFPAAPAEKELCVFVSKLPPNKKKPGFPVGGPRSE